MNRLPLPVRRAIVALVVIVLLLVVWDVVKSVASAMSEQRCTEDMACWDCNTMGNRVCGPVVVEQPDAA